MLVLQKSALNTGVLAPAMASSHAVTVFAWSSAGPSSMVRY